MNRRNLGEITAVVAGAIILRAIFFESAGIWGDWGFYVYNAELLNSGQMPFVDFIGRSPLFMQLYALISPYGNQAYVFRIYVLAWWLLAAAPVYGIARHIRGHHAGLGALLVYLYAPFSITYMFWGNTQSVAAFFLISGIYILVKRESIVTYAAVGSLVALAFLSRRSVVVVFAGLLLYLAYQYSTDQIAATSAVLRFTATTGTFVLTLFIGYLWLAQWDIGRAIAFADIHAVNLFVSSGRGGFPLLNTPPNPAVERATSGQIPILHDLCQRCGPKTALTFAKTLVLITPVVGILLYYCRDWAQRYFSTRQTQYVGGVLAALGLYGIAIAALNGYYVRTLSVIAVACFAVGVYQTDRVPARLLYHKRMVLLLCVLFALMAGYLYRARRIHTYYFMDFWPSIAIVAGVLYAHASDASTPRIRTVFKVALALSVINTAGAAYPITNVVLDGNDGAWFTVDSVQEYGDDMDARTQPGEEVLAASPSYVALSDANMVRDNARLYYTLVNFEDTGPGRDIYRYLLPRLQNGTIRYVVRSTLVDEMLYFNDSVNTAFESNYCPVDTDGLYERTNATLYQYTNESC